MEQLLAKASASLRHRIKDGVGRFHSVGGESEENGNQHAGAPRALREATLFSRYELVFPCLILHGCFSYLLHLNPKIG